MTNFVKFHQYVLNISGILVIQTLTEYIVCFDHVSTVCGCLVSCCPSLLWKFWRGNLYWFHCSFWFPDLFDDRGWSKPLPTHKKGLDFLTILRAIKFNQPYSGLSSLVLTSGLGVKQWQKLSASIRFSMNCKYPF